MRPLAVRLPPELIHWLDAHRGGEARTTFLRAILRDHIRRHSKTKAKTEAKTKTHARPALRDATKESTTALQRQPPLL